jgi:GTPase
MRKDFQSVSSSKLFLIEIVGFDEEGKMTNHGIFGAASWQQIVKNSVKIINFYDMGGSEGALKTTVLIF